MVGHLSGIVPSFAQLYFCKPLSVIPKWPKSCHMELVKAQSHDSKEEGRPSCKTQPACGSCWVQSLLEAKSSCLPEHLSRI